MRAPVGVLRDAIYLDDVALEYGEVPIIVGHMGGRFLFLRHFEAALMLAYRHKNVYLTTANAPPEFITRAVAEVGAERIFWASDTHHRALDTVAGLGHAPNLATLEQVSLTAAQKEAILGRNLAALLNIPVP